jgi:predicted RNase H-like HicB family nuclease
VSDYAISIFYDEEDGDYIAVVPDLKGCSAFGDTPEDALREIQIAKRLWLESARAHGDPIPEPLWRPDEAAKAAG